jgi:hypothetical protein
MQHIGRVLVASAALLAIVAGTGSLAGPSVVYETTVTGHELASGRGIVADAEGNAYAIVGEIGFENDIFVLKLGPGGSLLWGTAVRGNDHDFATDIALDAAGDVWVAGWTDSDDLPLVDPLQTELLGFRDVFLMKLSGRSGAILYSTYFGGDYADEAHALAIGTDGDIYLAGSTASTNFPTVDPLQGELMGAPYAFSDTFVTRLSPDGGSVLYSSDFPTQAPLQGAYGGGDADAFVMQLSVDGSALDFSTFLGGEDWERVSGLARGPDGAVYVAGSTRSIAFPTTTDAYQPDFVGGVSACEVPFGADYNCDDAFVAKLLPDGSDLAFSTYLGGTHIDECNGLAVDAAGQVHLVGFTSSSEFPPGGVGSPAVIFVAGLPADGSDLAYTVAKDSGSANAGHGIAIGPFDDVYFTGAIDVPADIYVSRLTREALPDVSISIASEMNQVPRGTDFVFDLTLTNDADVEQSVELWTAANRLPGGAVREPLKGPFTIMLQPGETRVFPGVRQPMGNAIPLGRYLYYSRVGVSGPGSIWRESAHELRIVP